MHLLIDDTQTVFLSADECIKPLAALSILGTLASRPSCKYCIKVTSTVGFSIYDVGKRVHQVEPHHFLTARWYQD